MKIEFKNTNYNLSPYTGLTRDSWIEAGIYLLNGAFLDVSDFQTPIIARRSETEITYPHKNVSDDVRKVELMAERFEGLARSFFIAAPLIHDNPELTIKNLNLREYYKSHLLRACTKADSLFVGTFEYMCDISKPSDPFPKFQQTVECAALVIGLWMTKAEIWDTYTKDEQDTIADFLKSFGYGNTHNNNWHMFNALTLAFLRICGYEIDESRMMMHVHTVLNYYAGDGWYRDGHGFDYYSCWAFNLYAPIWNVWYGYENAPEIAKKFEENSNLLMETFPKMFDKDGFTTMWGRSSIYRFAATSAFVGNAFLKNSTADFGLARRIMSGSLKQFLEREDFLNNGVPSLGFYREFSPILQGYSCASSPFWCGKAFLGLYFPKEHPLWNETENNGVWENINETIHETVLDGPALCITNHISSGETTLRTAKVTKNCIAEIHNYGKLEYNSKFPWEATPCNTKNIESQQYVISEPTSDTLYGNVIYYAGEKDDILYRKQYFGYGMDDDFLRHHAIYLSDFPTEYGLIRVDRLALHRWPVSITLGSYGMPDNGTEVIEKNCGNAKAIILKGRDFSENEKQLAMTIYNGWEQLKLIDSIGTNPDSEKSKIIYAQTERNQPYNGKESYILISQIITKESHEDFKEDEIFPIESVKYSDKFQTGLCGDITITLKNGIVKTINFKEVDGKISL